MWYSMSSHAGKISILSGHQFDSRVFYLQSNSLLMLLGQQQQVAHQAPAPTWETPMEHLRAQPWPSWPFGE